MYRQVKSIEPYVVHIHVYESKVALQRCNIKMQNKCLKIPVSLTESWRKGYATPTNKVYCFGEFASSERQAQFDAAKWEMDKNFLYFPLKAYLNP